MKSQRDRARESRRRVSLDGCLEALEDRRLMAASHADGELLIQYAASTSAALRNSIRALVRGRAEEVIETVAMRHSNAGVIERVKVGTGVSVERATAFLRNRPGVISAEPNWRLSVAAVSNDPYYTTNSRMWGMYGDDQPAATGPNGTTNAFGSQAEKAWDAGFTGSNSVVVGIVDEGVDISHPDLRDNIWVNPFEIAGDGVDNDGNGYVDDINGWDFVNGDNTVYDGVDDDHGTHVAGTIGAAGGNGLGVAGVSWDVTMISTKFLGPNGGYTSDAIRALDYLTDLKTRHGINIVASNNSWGGGGYSSALHSAILRAAKADILFVAAAGNSAVDTDLTAYYPQGYTTLQSTSTTTAAPYEAVLSVAALDSAGNLASYSNYGGRSVDLAAPGSGIWSTLPGGGYGAYNGTSMATPHVTGTIALYAAAYPQARAATIREAVLASTRPTASLAGKTVTGGRLDTAAAVRAAPPVGITISGGSVTEGNTGTTPLVFTVTLSAPAATDVTVAFATVNGSAAAGSDYVGQSGTLTFLAGETLKTIAVDVNGDTAFEANESFTITLSNPSANARIQTASAGGTILNDDSQPVLSLAISSVSGLEAAGSFRFTVTMSTASTSRVTVRYATANGSAVSGTRGDYTATSGTLTFNPGETVKTISVLIRNDSVVEPNETFFVNLSRASGATIAVGRGTGTILNDDGVTAARLAAFAAFDPTSANATKKK